MRNFARWIVRHRKVASVAFNAFWFILLLFNILAGGFNWLILIISFLGLFATNMLITTAPVEAIKQEAKIFTDHCDPFPMIEAIKDILNYDLEEWIRAAVERDYCNALSESGQYQAAYDRLRSINIDKSPATIPGTKLLYYVCLYETSSALEMNEEAEVWYQKAVAIYRDMKEDRFKKQLYSSMAMTMANHELMMGNLNEAVTLHDKATENTMLERVIRRFLLGRILLKQGKLEEAKAAFEYVVSNGNKLHCVQTAKELLESI